MMKPIFAVLLTVLLTACAAPGGNRTAAKGTQQIQTATIHVEKAKAASTRARVKIATGKEAAAELKRTASALQKPLVETLERSLAEAHEANEVMRVSLEVISPKLAAAQVSLEALAAAKARADRQAAGYRRLKLWLALSGAAGAAYIAFRLVPPLGPVRYYSMLAAGGVATTLIYTLL